MAYDLNELDEHERTMIQHILGQRADLEGSYAAKLYDAGEHEKADKHLLETAVIYSIMRKFDD